MITDVKRADQLAQLTAILAAGSVEDLIGRADREQGRMIDDLITVAMKVAKEIVYRAYDEYDDDDQEEA